MGVSFNAEIFYEHSCGNFAFLCSFPVTDTYRKQLSAAGRGFLHIHSKLLLPAAAFCSSSLTC